MSTRAAIHTSASGDPPVHPEVERYLEIAATRLGVAPSNLRVLDWGCGRGRSVFELRRRGWDVKGVDISPKATQAARALLSANDENGEGIVHLLDRSGRAPFENGSFDFIYSQEVFEHISDLPSALREIKRQLRQGGLAFHVFPARWRPQEPHYFIPFAHWLPKNRIRKGYIWLCCLLGVGVSSPVNRDAVKGKSLLEVVEFIYDYSVTQTFYYSVDHFEREFANHGFAVSFPVLDHRRLRKWKPLIRRFHLKGLMRWFMLTFVTIHVVAEVNEQAG